VAVSETPSGPVEAAPAYLAKAREVLERDHQHATLAFLFRDGEVVHSEVAGYETTAAKDAYLGQALPDRVAEHDADGVLLVGEAAGAQGDLLVVFAEQADGATITLSMPYLVRRFPRRVVLGPVATGAPGTIPAFDAVRRVWRGQPRQS
jgi:hypothetical protein